jgi:hypothetical protein
MTARVTLLTLSFLFFVALAHADNQPSPAAAARSALLSGVRVINSGGAPGVVLCVGSNAFPVVASKCGKAVQPVAAATSLGAGRVLALGHPSFCSSESLAKGDTATFVTNALAWLGQGQRTVAVYKNADFANALRALGGFEVREIPALDALSAFSVLAAYPDHLKPEELGGVRSFIASGGGLLACGIGWGWKQVSGGKSLATDNLFNRLLGPAGLLINDDLAERTAKDGYLADFPIPDCVNASEALARAAAGTVTDGKVLRQINDTVCAVKAVLPPGEADLTPALNALMRSPAASKLPSPAAPLKAADIPARLALIEHQSAWRARPLDPWPAHPSAAAYPGLPPPGAERTARTLTVNLDVPRWHSTGLYAAAGEPVTLEVPASAATLGLRLRIGSTTCDNTRHDEWRRAPKVDLEVPVAAASLTVSSPFGGLLYVVVPDTVEASERRIKVTLRNACRAAWFKTGRDTPAAWQAAIRKHPAPWAELESDKIILTVPSDLIRTLDDPAALLAFWERAADHDAKLTAIDPEGRRSAERFSSDVQLCAGWMHAGYPIMIPNVTAKELVSLDSLKSKGDWGFFHELGHNHQNGDWTFGGTGEVTVNFFTLYCLEHLCGIPPRQTRMGEAGIQKQVSAWVAKGKPHEEWCREPFLALETFVRLQQVFGWQAFEKLFAEYRTLAKEERPKSDGEKRDQWALRLSRITGQNIAAVFDAWNIPVSEEARLTCAKHPKPVDRRLFDAVN